MKYYGNVGKTLDLIVQSFENGDVPKKLAQSFISGASEKHCASYSFMNRFIVLLHGYTDAMGFKQWKKIGRNVKKNEKAVKILSPVIKKNKDRKIDEKTGEVKEEEETFCIGFRAVNVFGYEQTEGKPVKHDEEVDKFLDSLPLKNVAEKWGIHIDAYNGKDKQAIGMYSPNGSSIHLGTKNLSTWTHELAHAADDKLGNLEKDKRWLSEVAAELAGTTLLEAIGETTQSDRGGCWEYISKYAEKAGVKPIDACRMVIGRVSKIVDLILKSSECEKEVETTV